MDFVQQNSLQKETFRWRGSLNVSLNFTGKHMFFTLVAKECAFPFRIIYTLSRLVKVQLVCKCERMKCAMCQQLIIFAEPFPTQFTNERVFLVIMVFLFKVQESPLCSYRIFHRGTISS